MKKLRNSQFMLAVVIYGLEELQLVKRSDIITNLKLKTQFPEVATVTKNKAVDCNGGRLAFSWLRIYSFNVLHLFHVRNMEHETIGLWTNTNYTLSLFSNTKMEEELHDLHSDGYKQLVGLRCCLGVTVQKCNVLLMLLSTPFFSKLPT